MEIHHIPCEIDFNDETIYETLFRGHVLIGQKQEIPNDFTGLILTENDGENKIEKFDYYYNWNDGKEPDDLDGNKQLLLKLETLKSFNLLR